MEIEARSVSVDSAKPHASTCARAFLEALARAGARIVFGIPGGTVSPVFDALKSVPALRYVATRHEAGAGFAALGYARATGKPAIVLATSGPGVTNTLTAVASADAEELPLIVIGGEVPLRAFGRGALQDGTAAGWRAHEVLRPLTRWSGSLSSSTAPGSIASKAFSESTGARPGPVFVSLPLDVSASRVHSSQLVVQAARLEQAVSPSACRALADELARATRPLLILGNGARHASGEAVALAERVCMPVAVTAHAKGSFPERHPLYLGILGLGQHPSVDDYLRIRPDVSVVVGSGLDDLATNGWSMPLIGTRASFQIDRNVQALGRSLPFSHLVVGDAARVLETVTSFLPSDVARPVRSLPPRRWLRPDLAHSESSPIHPARAIRGLAAAFPDAVWCCDIGEHLAYALHYLDVDSPDDFHDFLGFGSMGSGIGAAIGMKLARPDERVVCICGDGGFSMLMGELLTCVEQRLPVVFAVMNDGRWSMVEHGFQTVFGEVPSGLVSQLADFATLARAMGAVGHTVTSPADLDAARLRTLAGAPCPLVLDIRIDASESLTGDTRSASLRHFCAEAK